MRPRARGAGDAQPRASVAGRKPARPAVSRAHVGQHGAAPAPRQATTTVHGAQCTATPRQHGPAPGTGPIIYNSRVETRAREKASLTLTCESPGESALSP